MLDVMYEIPSNDKVNKVIITLNSIKGSESPKLEEGPRAVPSNKRESLKAKAGINTAS